MLLEPAMIAHCHNSPRASKRADISRLLDPSYASSSTLASCSTSSFNQTKVYVDHDGDLHDPDYRDFPTFSPAQRRRVSASSSDLLSRDAFPRPSWELQEEDEDVFEEEEERYRSESRLSPQLFSRRSLSQDSRNLSPLFPSPRSLSPSPHFSAHFSSSSSSSSPTSDETWLSAVDSYETELKGRYESRYEHKLKKRRLVIGELDEQELLGDESDQEEEQTRDDLAPTCSDAMKKEWQALQLHVRIGVFRMKRRVRDSFK
ncbi:hypothetical protein C8J56DRAFT_962607 [Mycena floridula]|nr:hypothetical protein C8J56DRAFT_962607 [Mycena floridula]